MKRWPILIVALLVGAAAPARAWCEATCLAPAHHADGTTKPHCPNSEPADNHTKISAGNLDDCPIVEAARPTTFAKLDFDPAVANAAPHLFASSRLRTLVPPHQRTPAPSHLFSTPLRI